MISYLNLSYLSDSSASLIFKKSPHNIFAWFKQFTNFGMSTSNFACKEFVWLSWSCLELFSEPDESFWHVFEKEFVKSSWDSSSSARRQLTLVSFYFWFYSMNLFSLLKSLMFLFSLKLNSPVAEEHYSERICCVYSSLTSFGNAMFADSFSTFDICCWIF